MLSGFSWSTQEGPGRGVCDGKEGKQGPAQEEMGMSSPGNEVKGVYIPTSALWRCQLCQGQRQGEAKGRARAAQRD